MTTIALKKYLVSKIELIDDDVFLEEIKTLVDGKDKVYQLSDYHLNRLQESREQFEDGHFLTQEEMDLKVEEWLYGK